MNATTATISDAMTIGDVMCSAPRSVHVESKLEEAVAEMVHRQIRHLPVVQDDDVLVGMLSDRDVRNILGDPVDVLREERLGETLAVRVDEVMTRNPIAVRAHEPLGALASALLDERVGAVPVVDDDDHLIGIVSYIDVLHHALRGLG